LDCIVSVTTRYCKDPPLQRAAIAKKISVIICYYRTFRKFSVTLRGRQLA